jgi:uncharacterized protein (DUF1330 family)
MVCEFPVIWFPILEPNQMLERSTKIPVQNRSSFPDSYVASPPQHLICRPKRLFLKQQRNREQHDNERRGAYHNRIDATLAPFDGRFIVHGPAFERVEGDWSDGDLIIIGFPAMNQLKAWYGAEAYAAIKRLRTEHSDGEVIFVEGVPPGHRAPDVLMARK